MLFNSFEFLLFFPLVTILYFLLPHKIRWFHLLAASCYFYMAFVPVYILILFVTIVVDYIAGILIENAEGKNRLRYLALSIIVNVGFLAFFKYYNFFAENVNQVFQWSGSNTAIPYLAILLPIGLSFHTFQAMSYTIEVYRGNQKTERHFGIYALYVMFYPQLVAGPIERPQNMLHQFHEKHSLEYDNVASGLRQMMWGLIKKVVIADRLGMFVDPFFSDPRSNSGTGLLLGTFFFVFQLYCDFSGYSDIALGTARVMGFKLMTNFNRPFVAKSITEYWRRWHISLSTWFYDYLFNPTVTSLRNWGKGAIVFGLALTFMVSGLWHGAAWRFVIWGAIWSVAMIYEFYTKKQRKKIFGKLPLWLNNGLSIFITFSYCTFAAVFFRANDVKDALYIVKSWGRIPGEMVKVLTTRHIGFLKLPGIIPVLVPGFTVITFLLVAEYVQQRYHMLEEFNKKPAYLRWTLYYAGLFLLWYFGIYDKYRFIYFQF